MEYMSPTERDSHINCTNLDAFKKVGIVINICYGGFGISEWARQQFKERARADGYIPQPERTDEKLIELIEAHGSRVNGLYSSLIIEYIPNDYYINKCYRIDEYDGSETLVLLHNKYKLKKITEIIQNEKLSESVRIEQTKQLLDLFEEIVD